MFTYLVDVIVDLVQSGVLEGRGPGGGGRLGINYARMCVSKGEGYGSFFGVK